MEDVLLESVRNICKSSHGKNFIWHLLDICGTNAQIYEGEMKQQVGRRSVGLDILYLLEEADPEFYPKLLLEKIKMKKAGG